MKPIFPLILYFLIVNQGLTPSGEAMMVSVPSGFAKASVNGKLKMKLKIIMHLLFPDG
jgi:hypothetical protein